MEEFADREALRARFTRTMTTDVAARLKNEERDASYRMSPREEGPQVGNRSPNVDFLSIKARLHSRGRHESHL